MAQLLDFYLPYNDLTQYVPQNLRNSVISGLIDNLFNRFMTHDESIPLYGYVGRKPPSPDDRTPRVPQSNVERDLNAVIPVLNFSQGTTRYAFTVQDLVNKAKALGVNQEGLGWLYTQANNYLPPIDIDKFANFYNYFWIAKTLPTVPTTPWNVELRPEYYVIAKPGPSDNQKMNVVCATTGPIVRSGTGFEDQNFTIAFSTESTFTITANVPLGLYTTAAGNSGPQQFTFSFPALPTPDNDFTIRPTVENTFAFDVIGPEGTFTLMRFTISRSPVYDQDGRWSDNEKFIGGDQFLIDTIFLSLSYTVSSVSVTAGIKGKIKNVQSLNEYQTIDGVQVSEGQRVLVKNNSQIENGIYIVGPQAWTRSPDYDGANITQDALVWVAQGIANAGRLYESGPGNAWPDPAVPAIVTDSNTNDWQEGNFWVHASELTELGLSRSDAVQAVRPIIEYQSDLKLNGYISSGIPADSGSVFFKQLKTEFNQLPLFDLYRYDGTHSGLVSSVFYYVEDLTAELDLDLQKRVKTSSSDSADFVFNHGLVDAEGDLLFYKKGSALKTIWHAGYDEATAVDQTFVGRSKGKITELIPTTISVPQTWTLTALSTPASVTSTTFSVVGSITGARSDLTVGLEYVDDEFSITVTLGQIPFLPGEQFVFAIAAGPIVSPITYVGPIKGTIQNIVPTVHTQQQVWTIQATSQTQFSVSGSKTNSLPSPFDVITVGVPYSSDEFSCLISAGTQPYDIDDTFLFRIGNFETPRYVYRDSAELIFDLYGGEQADTNQIGAYTISRPFTYNPYNDARDEVQEGTLYGHFRGILRNQISGTPQNFAFGGAIKNWSEQQTLLASLLMQKDMTPISMIEMSQRQYENGLNMIADLYKTTVAQYFATVGVVDIDGTIEQDERLTALVDSILTTRSADYDVRTILYDTTSGVPGIPITLPQLGILALTAPSIAYDNILDGTFLKHHDGHTSILFDDNVSFRRSILNDQIDLEVLRFDGTRTPAVGSFTMVPPVRPHRGELWIRPIGPDSEMYAFNVDFDSQDEIDSKYILPSTPPVGTSVFRRTEGAAGNLYVWDGSNYILQPSFNQLWKRVDLADTLNQILLRVEERLYLNTNENIRRVDFAPLVADPAFSEQLKRELFTYGVKYGLDPLASDFIASDAFSWNYSAALIPNFPALDVPAVPARWFNVLMSHQRTVPGVIPTERPNLEPWKLLGFNTLAGWWGTLTSAEQASFTPYAYPAQLLDGTLSDAGVVHAIKTTGGTTFLGLQLIDGIQLNNGDSVLLQNESSAENNGVWTVSTGVWTRPSITYTLNMTIGVTQGSDYQNTVWALSASVPTVNVSPILFKQVRLWSEDLWAYVKIARSALRTSVDPKNDALLPPYVSSIFPESANALTTTELSTGTSLPYLFNENSLVETLWFRSIDFGYSLAKALFRHDPLYFLGFCWGFNWVEVDGILYDGYDVNTPGHKRFRLHGEPVRPVDRTNSLTISSAVGAQAVDVTLKYNAYEVSSGSRFQNFTVSDMNTGLLIGHVREGQVSSISAPLGIVSLTNILLNDFGQPFHTGDSFRITANADGSNLVWAFTPASSHQILGFGQTFTNALRELSVDTTDSYAIDAFRDWEVNMGYRAGGLVATDDLNVRTDNDTLTTASYELLFKKNEIAKDLWVQGLRITVVQFGDTVTIPSNGLLAPPTTGADWVFRIEGYNPRYQGISFYQLNTAGPFETFNILDQTVTTASWRHYTQPIGVQNTFLPLTITGIQNVVNFIFGYSTYLEDSGWAFNKDPNTNTDAETGRARTWQLEVEKFVNSNYEGTSLDTGHVLNPFMDKIWVRQDQGLLSEFVDTALFDITTNPGVFDLVGEKIPSSDLFTIRGNLESQFSANVPMFSAHAQLDQYEHLFIFNRYVEDSISNGLLYQPFSGSRVVTYKFNGRRQASNTFRPEFGGHYIAGSEVRQNLQASTDNVSKFYDSNTVFESDLTSRHALALLGFSAKTYFDNLDISDKSQFNFWRGLIQAKGTNLSISAYLNNNRFEDAKIDEYWAYKVATYGDARQNTYPELKLQTADTIQQFTQLQFDATVSLPNFTQITRYDEGRWFTLEDLDQDTFFKAEIVGSYSKEDCAVGEQIVLPFIADTLIITNATQLNARTLVCSVAGIVTATGYGPATPRYNPVKLFNYVANELVEEIPLWHPATGQHTPVSLESLNVISNQNPAKYNFSTQVVNNNSYDPLRPWGSNELGRTWFDTRNLAYIPYYDETIFPDRAERLSRWGALADYGTIDVYEWVQSTVSPLEYNALAAAQAGDGDLDPNTKAAGEVALEEAYYRDRQWSIRPIAWSYLATPFGADRGSVIPFGVSISDPEIQFHLEGVVSILSDTENATFESVGIRAGVGIDMRIGAWSLGTNPQKPIGEYKIQDLFTKIFVTNESKATSVSLAASAVLGTRPAVSVRLSSSRSISADHISLVGDLLFTSVDPNSTYTVSFDGDGAPLGGEVSIQIRCRKNTGEYEVVELGTYSGTTNTVPLFGTTIVLTAGDVIPVQFIDFGFTATVTIETSGTFPSTAVQQAIVEALGARVSVRDAVVVIEVVPNDVAAYTSVTLTNNLDEHSTPDDPMIGWAAWTVPTQAQLDADGKYPISSWRPYVGDFASTEGSYAQIQDALDESTKRTLNNGTSVDRYSTEWTDWNLLENKTLSRTQDSLIAGPLVIQNSDDFDSARTSVYVNGIAQLSASYTIETNTVTLSSVKSGSVSTVLIRHYEPSAEELAFDPAIEDDLKFQRQYKNDYEYVSLPVRDTEGSLSSSLYYFWVKNKSIAAKSKKLSIQSIAQNLRDGPSNFLTFQNLLDPAAATMTTPALPYRYDAITISGLSYVVGKDDTYKLRFTRNFTLRDDPQNLELKDTHTEWSIIRPGQRVRIPESLWQKLTDSISGQDAAGNAVPALRRVLYDERTGSATKYGFGSEQSLAPKDLLISSITQTIVNTKLINTSVPPDSDGNYPADFISFLNPDQSDEWFDTASHARQTMTDIWTSAKPSQINEVFFAALDDILASNYELTDIFKTSRLSAYSIKVVGTTPSKAAYE